jgi:hypothetical protein
MLECLPLDLKDTCTLPHLRLTPPRRSLSHPMFVVCSMNASVRMMHDATTDPLLGALMEIHGSCCDVVQVSTSHISDWVTSFGVSCQVPPGVLVWHSGGVPLWLLTGMRKHDSGSHHWIVSMGRQRCYKTCHPSAFSDKSHVLSCRYRYDALCCGSCILVCVPQNQRGLMFMSPIQSA